VLRQDFLTRQLSALFAALQRATARLEDEDVDGAMKEVDQGYTLLPGVDRSLLSYLSADAICDSLGDEVRLRALARLRATEAAVLTQKRAASPERVLRVAYQALLLYREVGVGGEEADAAVVQRLLACIEHLEAAKSAAGTA